MEELGKGKQNSQVYFLLTLGEDFNRVRETEEFYPLWTTNQKSLVLAKKIIDSFYHKLENAKKPLPLKAFSFSLSQSNLTSYTELPKGTKGEKRFISSILDVSKKIQKNPEGFFGLPNWPEINPRGIRDKAYLVFKKENKPLHFVEAAKLIPGSLVQTVHNELIKDPRFVLVGRGIYGLQEWGYQSGSVKDIILQILKEERKPLGKKEILKKALKQREVKENTILLNLSNKKYFSKNPQGKYYLN